MPRTRTSSSEPTPEEVFPPNPLEQFITVFHEDWKSLPLAAKLAKIGGAVGTVPKNGWNAVQRYKFVQETDLVAAVRPYFAAAGILLHFSVTEHEIIPRQNPDAKGLLTRIKLHYTVTDGIAVIEGDMDGYGMDTGDKGVYKAITGAKKYTIMLLLMIDTGDDPERDTKTDEMAALGEIIVHAGKVERRPPLFIRTDEDERMLARMEEAEEDNYPPVATPPVVSPLRRTDVVRGGHTTGATDTQKDRLIAEVRAREWGALKLLSFIRKTFGAALIDAPEDDLPRLRGYITELLDSLSTGDMGKLLVAINDE